MCPAIAPEYHVLLEADSEEQVSVKADENSGVMWFLRKMLGEIYRTMVRGTYYSKLIKKMGI